MSTTGHPSACRSRAASSRRSIHVHFMSARAASGPSIASSNCYSSSFAELRHFACMSGCRSGHPACRACPDCEVRHVRTCSRACRSLKSGILKSKSRQTIAARPLRARLLGRVASRPAGVSARGSGRSADRRRGLHARTRRPPAQPSTASLGEGRRSSVQVPVVGVVVVSRRCSRCSRQPPAPAARRRAARALR